MKIVAIDSDNGFDEYFGTAITNPACIIRLPLVKQKNVFLRVWTFNLGHNILELYNVLAQGRLAESKTKLDN